MSLLQEVHKMMKNMEMPKLHDRNFVAKHAQRAGAGVHKDKKGPNAPRHRQKQQWKREEM
jgi:alcohol dehydrogenase class IV